MFMFTKCSHTYVQVVLVNCLCMYVCTYIAKCMYVRTYFNREYSIVHTYSLAIAYKNIRMQYMGCPYNHATVNIQ